MARPNRIGREEFGLPLGIADKRFIGTEYGPSTYEGGRIMYVHMNMYNYKYRESNADTEYDIALG